MLPSWRWHDWSMFSHLESELKRFNIKPIRRNDSNFYRELANDEIFRNEIDGFYQMMQTFLSLHKNSSRPFAWVKRRLHNDDPYCTQRNETFLYIYRRIFHAYEMYLFKTGQYDFADMINIATKNVREITDCALGYRYILLDEVQDLSRNRFLLVKAIMQKNPQCKLFAVGDDWQSIYRFTGSDLSLIQDFGRFFGLKTRQSLIESTHRFGQPTIDLSCNFIQRNPTQSHKFVRNIQKSHTPIFVILNRPQNHKNGQDAESLQIILLQLINEYGYETLSKKSLQVISRYNHDIKRLDSEQFDISLKDDTAKTYHIS